MSVNLHRLHPVRLWDIWPILCLFVEEICWSQYMSRSVTIDVYIDPRVNLLLPAIWM